MSGQRTFDPKVVLGLILFGAIAFIATLYFIGAGETNSGTNDGGAHGAGKGLNGYAALAGLLERDGHGVTLSRSEGQHDTDSLLILTPPSFTDGEELQQIIDKRRYRGPTLVILPKWMAMRADMAGAKGAEEGWVALVGASAPQWIGDLDYDLDVTVKALDQGRWEGLGSGGSLPEKEQVMAGTAPMLAPLVKAPGEKILAGFIDDGDSYPLLEEAAGFVPDENAEVDRWAVVFVIEPDLMNNYGMADSQRAELAHALVDLAMENEDLPVVFDLTLNGLGAAQNLLTLAFTPPFLAATLCLILALLVIGWRAFRRFGPPVADGRGIAFGKTRLVRNSAAFIQRSRRLHLLTGPYADMLRERIVRALALRKHDDDEALDAVVARRHPGLPGVSQSIAELRAARTPQEILRAAAALKAIERTISQ